MVNAKHDTTSFENCGYQREIFDGNSLYDAFIKAKKGSDWKSDVQRFEMTYLLGLSDMQKRLMNRTYSFHPTSEFTLNERGKTRYIHGEQITDRIVKHSLCDEVLTPTMRKFLIYDNGASLQGRGIDFTRKRLLTHLRKYYTQHKSNEGYILLIDFTKYYDNIRHDKLMEMFRKYIHDDCALWLLEETVKQSRIDVSFLSDEEYLTCIDEVFNSLDYYSDLDRSLLIGEKFLNKHLNIGDQVAQVSGISYPIPIDNHVKIVRGVKFYGRYMDDSYVIHDSYEFLWELLQEIICIAEDLGITINLRKTRVCKLSEYWRFLQVQYSLTETGRIIQKINPKQLTRMRRKMKKLAYILNPLEFSLWFSSWFKGYYKLMSELQRENIVSLFEELKEVNLNVFNHSEQWNTVVQS